MYNSCAIYSRPGSSSGSSGTGFTAVVTNYSALPAAASATGEFYFVQNSQGTSWLPGTLGGTYYPVGTYYSDGATWVTGFSPYQATLANVNLGIITDQFVSPFTFTNASKWDTKQNVLSGTGIVYSTAGTISYYTTTGSGTVAALQTSPIFLTDITTPKVIGGTGVTSKITYVASTNAAPTSTAIAHEFMVGNNGTIAGVTILHNGRAGFGTAAPGAPIHIYNATGGASNGLRIETGGTGNTGYASIDFSTPTSSTHLQIVCYGSTATNANYALWYNNNAGTIWYAAGTAYMHLNSTGSLRVG